MDIRIFENIRHEDNPTHYIVKGRCKTFPAEIMKDASFTRAVTEERIE
jgi:hypothetical protein